MNGIRELRVQFIRKRLQSSEKRENAREDSALVLEFEEWEDCWLDL